MKQDIKILLIKPPSSCVEDDRLEPSLGLLYIASTVRQNGYRDVSVYDMSGCKSNEEILEKMNNIPKADIYGVNAFSTNYNYAKDVIGRIKKDNPTAYVAIGGPGPSGLREYTYDDSGADVVVVGEGEDVMLSCIESYISGSPIKGAISATPRDDIDTFPFPARDLADMKTYSRTLMEEPVASLISSRGCKYRCIYCNSVVMGGGSRRAMYRSPDNLLAEMKGLREKYRHFRFNDDHFTGNPELKELLRRIEDLDTLFRAFARIEDLDGETSGQLVKAGCVLGSIGLESLNPDNLRLLGRANQIGKEGNVKVAKSKGLKLRASFMVGLPHDSGETIERYFLQASKLGLDEFAVYPIIPYPGTQLWKNPEKFGYTIVNRDFTQYVQIGIDGNTCYALKHEKFGPDDVEKWKLRAEEILVAGGVKHMRDSTIAR